MAAAMVLAAAVVAVAVEVGATVVVVVLSCSKSEVMQYGSLSLISLLFCVS